MQPGTGSEQIDLALKTASNILGKVPERTSKTDTLLGIIPEMMARCNPTLFYQWFCSAWQSLESLHSTEETENDWSNLVQNSIEKFLGDASEGDPKLRAMCASYVFVSVDSHPTAQMHALRMIIQLATELKLAKDQNFLSWIIGVMRQHIEACIEIQENQILFVSVIIRFFATVEAFNHDAIVTLCRIFSSSIFSKLARKVSKKDLLLLPDIATKAFHSILNSSDLFDYELITDSRLLVGSLDETDQELITIFTEYGVEDYLNFLKHYPKYITMNKLNEENMLSNIRILTFISVVEGHDRVLFSDLVKYLKIKQEDIMSLVIAVNESGAARVKINSYTQEVFIEHCQPRKFTNEVWEHLSNRISVLSDALKEIREEIRYE